MVNHKLSRVPQGSVLIPQIFLLSQRIQPLYLLMAQNLRGRTKPFNYSYIAYPNAGGRGVAYFRQIRTRART